MRTSAVLVVFALAACGDDAPSDAGADVTLDASPDVASDAAGSADSGDASGDVDAQADASPSLPPECLAENGPGPEYLPPSCPGMHDVEVVDTRVIVPGPGIPDEAQAQNSNNNLDVLRFDGRVWMVWRTSPDHFAGPETRIHVVSSTDEQTWRYEASFERDTDLREPRFFAHGGRLFLYLAELGTNRLDFEPRATLYSVRGDDGTWSELSEMGLPNFIAWRVRTVDDVPIMIGYSGGENVYDFDGEPVFVEMLTTTDGIEWTALNPDRRVVSEGGGSESDFAFRDDGTLVSVIRNEAGDETGLGSKICTAPASDITDWTCATDPRKYDSPLAFARDGEVYIVGRRNVTPTGHYDVDRPDVPVLGRAVLAQAEYTAEPKRCSLWRVDEATGLVVFVLDLPSRGDTCFASIIDGDADDELILYNYTSPLDTDEDPSWREGQDGPTQVVRHVLRFTQR